MIYIYVDHKERLDFYSRMTASMELLNKAYTLITHKLSLYLIAKSRKLNIELVKTTSNHWAWDYKYMPLEVENGYLDNNSAFSLYSSYCEHFIYKTKCDDVFFIWNGNDTPCIALKKIASLKKAQLLFFEQPNIKGKLLVDCLGTNADSSLATKNEILKYPSSVSDEVFEELAGEIINSKRNKIIPQRKINAGVNYYHIIDVICSGLHITPRSDNRTLVDKLKNKFKTKRLELSYSEVCLRKNYVFVPLQIESDTQLVRHSSYSNLDVVKYGYKLSSDFNSDVYVKLHPAEVDECSIREITDFCEINNIPITNADTYDLIDNSTFVVLNNSTVGLEALLMNKNVISLGNPFYKHFKKNELKNYLFEYLIQDVDYFGDQQLSTDAVKEILKRLTNE